MERTRGTAAESQPETIIIRTGNIVPAGAFDDHEFDSSIVPGFSEDESQAAQSATIVEAPQLDVAQLAALQSRKLSKRSTRIKPALDETVILHSTPAVAVEKTPKAPRTRAVSRAVGRHILQAVELSGSRPMGLSPLLVTAMPLGVTTPLPRGRAPRVEAKQTPARATKTTIEQTAQTPRMAGDTTVTASRWDKLKTLPRRWHEFDDRHVPAGFHNTVNTLLWHPVTAAKKAGKAVVEGLIASGGAAHLVAENQPAQTAAVSSPADAKPSLRQRLPVLKQRFLNAANRLDARYEDNMFSLLTLEPVRARLSSTLAGTFGVFGKMGRNLGVRGTNPAAGLPRVNVLPQDQQPSRLQRLRASLNGLSLGGMLLAAGTELNNFRKNAYAEFGMIMSGNKQRVTKERMTTWAGIGSVALMGVGAYFAFKGHGPFHHNSSGGSGGHETVAAGHPTSHPTHGSGVQTPGHHIDKGGSPAAAGKHHSGTSTVGHNGHQHQLVGSGHNPVRTGDKVTVHKGDGYTNLIHRYAQKHGYHDNGAQDYRAYLQLQHHLGQHILSGDHGYSMGGHNLGISHPGTAHWNEHAERILNKALKATKKKRQLVGRPGK